MRSSGVPGVVPTLLKTRNIRRGSRRTASGMPNRSKQSGKTSRKPSPTGVECNTSNDTSFFDEFHGLDEFT
jgi:hypothetical protein